MNLQMQARMTVVLAAACGLSGLLVLLFWLGVGTGYSFLPPDPDASHKLPSLSAIEKQNFQMADYPHFAEITQRPLFSEDRRPIPLDQEQDDGKPEAPPVPLQVQLTGVIITPDLKMALLKDRMTNKDVNLKEGMPLPGQQATWLLVEIDPRKVVFKNEQDDISEVELSVSKTNGPPSPRIAAPGRPDAGPNPPESDAQKSLRERIEARRKQLREQARKMRAQQQRANEQKQESSR